MPAAIAVPLISAAVSGATTIIGSKMASNASRRAADTQVAGAARAEEDTRRSTQQALDYIERARMGGMPAASPSMGYLGRLMGLPGASGGGMPGGPSPAGTLKPGASFDMPGSRRLNIGADGYSQLFGAMPGANAGPAGAAVPRSGGTVMLRAPDGRTRAVPADQADHFLRLGATRVQ